MTSIEPQSVDPDDRALVAALQYAPRAPLDRLAAALGTSPRTVGRRYARLTGSGLLRVITEVDWSLRAEGPPVHVRLAAAPGAAHELAATLAARSDTTFVALCSGRADVFAVVHGPTRAATSHAVLAELPALPGVVSVRSDWVLRRLTSGAAWCLPGLTEEQKAQLDDRPAPDAPPGALPEEVPDDRCDGRPLSATERAIAAALAADGRLSFAEIARAAGLTESRARRQTVALLDRGLLRPRVEIEPRVLGHRVEALVDVTCAPADLDRVATALRDYSATRFLAVTASTSLLSLVVVVPDEDALATLLGSGWVGAPGTVAECALLLDVVKRYWTRPGGAGTVSAGAAPSAPRARPATP